MTTIALPGTIIALVLAAILAVVAGTVIATLGRVLDRDRHGRPRESTKARTPVSPTSRSGSMLSGRA